MRCYPLVGDTFPVRMWDKRCGLGELRISRKERDARGVRESERAQDGRMQGDSFGQQTVRSARCDSPSIPMLHGGPRRLSRPLLPEVPELYREVSDALLDQRNGVLKLVSLRSRDTHGVALDARLYFELAVLDELDYLFCQILLDADADRYHLFDFVAADLLDVAELERTNIDAALGQLPKQHIGDLFELEIIVREQRELLFLVLDARVRALEIETRRDFLVGLVERIADFDLIDFGDDVERGHRRLFSILTRKAGFDAHAQGIEFDETLGVLLIVRALVVFEGCDRRVEQRTGLRIAAGYDHVALVELEAHRAVHGRLRRVDHRLQQTSLG